MGANLRRYRVEIGVALTAVLAVLLFLGWSAANAGLGFPLDDGWIHQTYARNLVQTGQWAYVPGTVSAGSTSPLWTLLLAVGYALSLPPLAWAYLLGAFSLAWLAWAAIHLWRRLWPAHASRAWLGGLVLVFSWPLLWAAASGMETLLFLALAVTLLALYAAPQQAAGWLGFLSGLLILVRPDGLILVLLLAVGLAARRSWRPFARFLVALLLPLLPYFALNYSLSAQLWPNTLYAKQAEYAPLLEAESLPFRFLRLLFFSLGGPETGWRGMSGARLLLLPGLLLAGWRALRADLAARRLTHTLPLLWAGGHILAYAWRLPATYQHGRYLWAALPVWILFGLHGWRQLLIWARRRDPRSGRLLTQAALLTFSLLLLLFLVLGAGAYATDVAFIDGEMVTVAHWLRENTPPDALIAAHDIGAIGYFAQRPLLDLAGLLSPEIVPLLGDEALLAGYVVRSDADYLVTAPGWPYPSLVGREDVTYLYDTGYAWTREQGWNNMAVYRLPD